MLVSQGCLRVHNRLSGSLEKRFVVDTVVAVKRVLPLGDLQRSAIKVRFEETLATEHAYTSVVVDKPPEFVTSGDEYEWGREVIYCCPGWWIGKR